MLVAELLSPKNFLLLTPLFAIAPHSGLPGVEKQRIRYPDTLFYEAWSIFQVLSENLPLIGYCFERDAANFTEETIKLLTQVVFR